MSDGGSKTLWEKWQALTPTLQVVLAASTLGLGSGAAVIVAKGGSSGRPGPTAPVPDPTTTESTPTKTTLTTNATATAMPWIAEGTKICESTAREHVEAGSREAGELLERVAKQIKGISPGSVSDAITVGNEIEYLSNEIDSAGSDLTHGYEGADTARGGADRWAELLGLPACETLLNDV